MFICRLLLKDRMGLKTKNVHILGVFRGVGVTKNNTYGELSKKRSLDNLQGNWQKIGGWCF